MTFFSGFPRIIQGGMGVGVSNWQLANAVARAGGLGVVSGSLLDTVFVRRLQDGDLGGHMRRAIAAFPKPLIAAVNGYALGGGCELALCADILVAGSNAQFGQPEINLGMIPGAGGTQRLARVAGKALTMLMVLAGQPIDAQAAVAAGIAVEADEPESALARAVEIASLIAAKPALAVRLAKEAVLRAYEAPMSEALAAERQAFALLAASHDRNEGIAAFLEKRPPQFTGR
jgi:enoyl-CoA hydratase